ncbi:MAG: pyruvate kinase [Mariprofundaceae bacterium]
MNRAGKNPEKTLKLLKNKRTKIIATLGPACADEHDLRKLIASGVNIFRLNMSHGEHATHRENHTRIRTLAAEVNAPIAVLADLGGPKIRTGSFKDGGIELKRGETITLTMRDTLGEAGLIPSQYANLAADVAPDQRIFLADGLMELRVERIADGDVICRVEQGGMLGDHKGINLPDACVSAPSMTEKDFRDAEFAVQLGVDFLALSFVRRVEDIRDLRHWLQQQALQPCIIAKIERPEALRDAEAIIAAADGIMVARGDLGVELPPEEVPIAQKMLIDAARAQHKPVIVATQILESMIEHARPTRAETTDIFHSVSSGADALMLSGETAIGAHPRLAVETMNRTIRHAETYLWQTNAFGAPPSTNAVSGKPPETPHGTMMPFGDAVAGATAKLSRDLMVRAIIVLSCSGATAAMVSAARPESPVIAVATDVRTVRCMNLLWGVIPVLAEADDIQDMAGLARRLAREHNLATHGDSILLVQGFHTDPQKNHPSITILCT